MSQLALSLAAGMSTRHLSYVETGKSQASRESLGRLADAFEMPLRERNRLLVAGGFAPEYSSTWMDVNFNGMIVAHGDYDTTNKTWTFRADDLREVLHVVDGDHFTYEYFEAKGGKEALAVRLEYTRTRPH